MSSLPSQVMNAFEKPTQDALRKVNPADMQQLLNAPLLAGMQGAQLIGMPGLPPRPQLKEALIALLADKSMLGAAIDARVAEAVKKVPASSGMNASSVDAKIKTALEGVDSKITDAVKDVTRKGNLEKLRVVSSGGGRRRGTKRGRRGKRGTKRR